MTRPARIFYVAGNQPSRCSAELVKSFVGDTPMKWVTRERPVIDRIACPWLITRFIDKEPEFLFVPPDQVARVAEETGAIPFDVPGVEFTHVGEGCSFDTFVSKYGLDRDPAI